MLISKNGQKAGVFEDLTGKDYLKNLKEGAAETYAINDKIYSIPLTKQCLGILLQCR